MKLEDGASDIIWVTTGRLGVNGTERGRKRAERNREEK